MRAVDADGGVAAGEEGMAHLTAARVELPHGPAASHAGLVGQGGDWRGGKAEENGLRREMG